MQKIQKTSIGVIAIAPIKALSHHHTVGVTTSHVKTKHGII